MEFACATRHFDKKSKSNRPTVYSPEDIYILHGSLYELSKETTIKGQYVIYVREVIT